MINNHTINNDENNSRLDVHIQNNERPEHGVYTITTNTENSRSKFLKQ